jgi:hypothetical protein
MEGLGIGFGGVAGVAGDVREDVQLVHGHGGERGEEAPAICFSEAAPACFNAEDGALAEFEIRAAEIRGMGDAG